MDIIKTLVITMILATVILSTVGFALELSGEAIINGISTIMFIQVIAIIAAIKS